MEAIFLFIFWLICAVYCENFKLSQDNTATPTQINDEILKPDIPLINASEEFINSTDQNQKISEINFNSSITITPSNISTISFKNITTTFNTFRAKIDDFCTTNSSLTIPNIYDCQSYYECNQGELIPRLCPENTFWDCLKKTCTPSTYELCCPKDKKPHNFTEVCSHNQNEHNPVNCSTYLHCGKKLQVKECLKGERFDMIQHECTDENTARCLLQNCNKSEDEEKMRNEVRDMLQKELEYKLNREIKKKLSEEKAKIKKEIRDKLNREIKVKMIEEREKVRREMRNKFSKEFRSKLNKEMKHKFNKEVKDKLNKEVRDKLIKEVKEKLNKEVRDKLNMEVKSKLNQEMGDKWNIEIKDKLNFSVSQRLDNEVDQQVNEELVQNLNKVVKEKLNEEMKEMLQKELKKGKLKLKEDEEEMRMNDEKIKKENILENNSTDERKNEGSGVNHEKNKFVDEMKERKVEAERDIKSHDGPEEKTEDHTKSDYYVPKYGEKKRKLKKGKYKIKIYEEENDKRKHEEKREEEITGSGLNEEKTDERKELNGRKNFDRFEEPLKKRKLRKKLHELHEEKIKEDELKKANEINNPMNYNQGKNEEENHLKNINIDNKESQKNEVEVDTKNPTVLNSTPPTPEMVKNRPNEDEGNNFQRQKRLGQTSDILELSVEEQSAENILKESKHAHEEKTDEDNDDDNEDEIYVDKKNLETKTDDETIPDKKKKKQKKFKKLHTDLTQSYENEYSGEEVDEESSSKLTRSLDMNENFDERKFSSDINEYVVKIDKGNIRKYVLKFPKPETVTKPEDETKPNNSTDTKTIKTEDTTKPNIDNEEKTYKGTYRESRGGTDDRNFHGEIIITYEEKPDEKSVAEIYYEKFHQRKQNKDKFHHEIKISFENKNDNEDNHHKHKDSYESEEDRYYEDHSDEDSREDHFQDEIYRGRVYSDRLEDEEDFHSREDDSYETLPRDKHPKHHPKYRDEKHFFESGENDYRKKGYKEMSNLKERIEGDGKKYEDHFVEDQKSKGYLSMKTEDSQLTLPGNFSVDDKEKTSNRSDGPKGKSKNVLVDLKPHQGPEEENQKDEINPEISNKKFDELKEAKIEGVARNLKIKEALQIHEEATKFHDDVPKTHEGVKESHESATKFHEDPTKSHEDNSKPHGEVSISKAKYHEKIIKFNDEGINLYDVVTKPFGEDVNKNSNKLDEAVVSHEETIEQLPTVETVTKPFGPKNFQPTETKSNLNELPSKLEVLSKINEVPLGSKEELSIFRESLSDKYINPKYNETLPKSNEEKIESTSKQNLESSELNDAQKSIPNIGKITQESSGRPKRTLPDGTDPLSKFDEELSKFHDIVLKSQGKNSQYGQIIIPNPEENQQKTSNIANSNVAIPHFLQELTNLEEKIRSRKPKQKTKLKHPEKKTHQKDPMYPENNPDYYKRPHPEYEPKNFESDSKDEISNTHKLLVSINGISDSEHSLDGANYKDTEDDQYVYTNKKPNYNKNHGKYRVETDSQDVLPDPRERKYYPRKNHRKPNYGRVSSIKEESFDADGNIVDSQGILIDSQGRIIDSHGINKLEDRMEDRKVKYRGKMDQRNYRGKMKNRITDEIDVNPKRKVVERYEIDDDEDEYLKRPGYKSLKIKYSEDINEDQYNSQYPSKRGKRKLQLKKCAVETKVNNVKNCHKYFKCLDGNVISQRCPGELFYNCWTHKCEKKGYLNCCKSMLPYEKQCSGNRFIPDPKNCSGYYSCWNNTKFVHNVCKNGMMFDVWSNMCKENDVAICALHLAVKKVY